MKKVGRLYRERITDELSKGVQDRQHTFVMSYTGVSALQMSTLRKDLKRAGAKLYVAQNALAQRALQKVAHQTLADRVASQTAFVFSDDDSVEVSKILMKFCKDREGVLVQGGVLEGKLLETDDVKRLSELPSLDVLRAMLLSAIQAPLTRLAGALSGKTRELLSILKQASEKKGGN